MRSLYAAAFALLCATAAVAQGPAVAPAAQAAEVTAAAVSATSAVRIPERAALQAPRLQGEQREAPADAATQAELQRGSFWWLVAVIVVAGVILALIL